jgi:TolB-like protein
VHNSRYFVFLLIIVSTLSFAENTSVAVIDLKNAGGVPEHFSTLLSEALRAEMFKYDKFDVRNREDVKSVLEEQAFQQSGACDDNACFVRIGKVLGVEKIITGSIGKLGNTYSMTIKQIDIETSANDKIISNRKQCSEDDLFIMIENAVKELVRIENNKLTVPGEFKEIKEIQPQKLTPADGFDVNKSDDLKEWEILGLTRNEFIEYKRCGVDFSNWRNIEKFRIKNHLSHSENISYLSSGLTFEEWIKNNQYSFYLNFETLKSLGSDVELFSSGLGLSLEARYKLSNNFELSSRLGYNFYFDDAVLKNETLITDGAGNISPDSTTVKNLKINSYQYPIYCL